MRPWSNAFAAIVVLTTVAPKAGADFTPGHVYVAATSPEGCFLPFYANDRVWDINPVTGESSILGEVPDEECGLMRDLDFTPDGTGLRAAERFTHSVLEFSANGNVTVALDNTDGLIQPRNMAYDAQGNFYVDVVSPPRILKFPAAGGPATVFADESDGVFSGGTLAFAPNGDLYYANVLPAQILRFSPDGDGELFDTLLGAIHGIDTDAQGHLFALTGAGLYRYDAGDPVSQVLLASGITIGEVASIAASPDSSSVYIASANQLVSVDATSGSLTLLAEVPDDFGGISWFGSGIDVFVPEPSSLTVVTIATGWVCLRRRRRVAARSTLTSSVRGRNGAMPPSVAVDSPG